MRAAGRGVAGFHHAPLLAAWLALTFSLAVSLGAAFALHATTPAARRPRRRWFTLGNRGSLRQYQPISQRRLPSQRPSALLSLTKPSRLTTPSSLLRLGAVNSAAGGGGAAASASGGSGGGSDSGSGRDSVTGGTPADRAAYVQAETQRLMSVPTIDIKLELQMRGVEHRDAFEKVDLARRLAEAQLSSSPSAAARGPPQATGAAAASTGRDGNDGGGGGGRTNTYNSREEDVAAAAKQGGLPAGNVKHGGWSPSTGGGSSEDGGGKESTSSQGWRTTPSSRSTSAFGDAPEQAAPPGEGKADEDALHARDVSRAMSMGKRAVSRELNAMGIAHSRLSDVSVLARQYASGRQGIREEAEEARRFRFERELEGREEASRPPVFGRAEIESRLRAQGVRFSSRSTDAALAALLAREGDGSGGNVAALDGVGGAHDGGGGRDKGQKRGGDERSGRERSSARGRWGRATSGLPWNVGRKQRNEEEEQEEEEEDEGEGGGGEGEEKGVDVGMGKNDQWGGAWELADRAAAFAGGEDDPGSETKWSVGGNDGSVASSTDEEGSVGISMGVGAAGAAGKKDRKASLQARGDRMSSRELMNALDSLGAHYQIPTGRPALQQAFVSAVLAEEERAAAAAAGDGPARGRDGGDRDNLEIVPISPYSAEGEGEPTGAGREQTGFETYHSALRWARQLNFDEVLEELRYRAVTFDPRADYSYLTRLLADEVLADEELMQAEDEEGAYNAELDIAMAMSAQEIIRDLRARGERADVTSSKEKLAENLALLNLRNRAESRPGGGGDSRGSSSRDSSKVSSDRHRPPLPQANEQSGSSSEYRRRRPPQGWGRVSSDDGAGGGSGGMREGGGGVGGGFGELLGFGDSERERDGDDKDVLLELGEAVRSVGGLAWLAVQETAAFMAGAAGGLFPDAFPEDEEDVGSVGRGAPGAGGQQRRAGRRPSPSSPSSSSWGPSAGGRARRSRAMRERVSGVRRAAAGFAQSSANRAGLAVARSLANGVLRGAEAAADWAGGGALSREYVLLFVAAFCLAFKRGVGASVALLIVIRASRITVQRFASEGWAAGRDGKTGPGGGARRPAAAAPAPADAAPRRRRNAPTGSSSSSSAPSSFSGRRTPAAEARRDKGRRRSKTPRPSGGKRVKPSSTSSGSARGGGVGSSGRKGRSRREPLWDESDDDSEGGCMVM